MQQWDLMDTRSENVTVGADGWYCVAAVLGRVWWRVGLLEIGRRVEWLKLRELNERMNITKYSTQRIYMQQYIEL